MRHVGRSRLREPAEGVGRARARSTALWLWREGLGSGARRSLGGFYLVPPSSGFSREAPWHGLPTGEREVAYFLFLLGLEGGGGKDSWKVLNFCSKQHFKH